MFGDYDCDGICGTAVLWETLYGIGVKAMPFIPERDKHGYGLSDKALDDILNQPANQLPQLLITVDNGVVAYDAFARLKKLNIKTILTDHHQPDPRNNEIYPPTNAKVHTTKLCGTTVAWMLARELDSKKAESMSGLCAIASIADQVPHFNAKRSVAKHGIVALRESKRAGLNFLIEYANLDKQKSIRMRLTMELPRALTRWVALEIQKMPFDYCAAPKKQKCVRLRKVCSPQIRIGNRSRR